MSQRLLSPRFLFRFAAPCQYRNKPWSAQGTKLTKAYRLLALDELDDRQPWADVRAAWSEEGLAFSVRVEGKRSPARCDTGRPLESDGMQLWIDTRDTHNVHRASRFCYRFVCLPFGNGPDRGQPLLEQVRIHRAREESNPVSTREVFVHSERRVDGYLLECLFPNQALRGFDSGEHGKIGFTYVIRDHELGQQTWSCWGPLPWEEDPSLWGTLDLVR
jgi:hypothetical protein